MQTARQPHLSGTRTYCDHMGSLLIVAFVILSGIYCQFLPSSDCGCLNGKAPNGDLLPAKCTVEGECDCEPYKGQEVGYEDGIGCKLGRVCL